MRNNLQIDMISDAFIPKKLLSESWIFVDKPTKWKGNISVKSDPNC